jgi:hypothetical protein
MAARVVILKIAAGGYDAGFKGAGVETRGQNDKCNPRAIHVQSTYFWLKRFEVSLACVFSPPNPLKLAIMFRCSPLPTTQKAISDRIKTPHNDIASSWLTESARATVGVCGGSHAQS